MPAASAIAAALRDAANSLIDNHTSLYFEGEIKDKKMEDLWTPICEIFLSKNIRVADSGELDKMFFVLKNAK